MTGQLRILVTGSRRWANRPVVSAAISEAMGRYSTLGRPVLVHGGAIGLDAMADEIWTTWYGLRPGWILLPEVHPARDHASPRARNQHMVDLGATVCLAFAMEWASGTGMCARMARAAGIHTIDLGVNTASRRPA